MIAYLQGELKAILDNSLILELNGIGYELFIPKQWLAKYRSGNKAEFYIYQQIKEDSVTLFGFQHLAERNLFLHLISISGVGPKTAIQFFDTYSHDEIIRAITQKDHAAISRISGIGKKTSERIILELQDKFLKLYGNNLAGSDKISKESLLESSFKEDLIEALITLGYPRRFAEELLIKHQVLLSQQDSVETALKSLLTRLS